MQAFIQFLPGFGFIFTHTTQYFQRRTQAGVGADAAETKDAAHGDGNPVAAAAAPQASAAANPQDALDGSAAPTEGTALSKAAVCEIDAQKADALGIKVPGLRVRAGACRRSPG